MNSEIASSFAVRSIQAPEAVKGNESEVQLAALFY